MLMCIVVATKRSDKYLLQQTIHDRPSSGGQQKKTKKSKKGKKSKHRTGSSDDSDTEPQLIHHVSTFIEMPEGASLSDIDDANAGDADDPHRALDINLDM